MLENVEQKLRQLLDITEDEAYFHTRQSAFLYHLGVQTMPKTHHCLNMRLTVEYFKSRSSHMDRLNEQKLEIQLGCIGDPHVIFPELLATT